MHPDPPTEAPRLDDQLLARHRLEIFVHDASDTLGCRSGLLQLRGRNFAEVVGFDAQRPVRLGVVVLVSDVRRQLHDLALREEPRQVRKEFVRNVDRDGADAVRIFQRDSLPLGQVAGFLDAERDLDRLARETSPTADGGIDINSEGQPLRAATRIRTSWSRSRLRAHRPEPRIRLDKNDASIARGECA
jgi:hypothetical protein